MRWVGAVTALFLLAASPMVLAQATDGSLLPWKNDPSDSVSKATQAAKDARSAADEAKAAAAAAKAASKTTATPSAPTAAKPAIIPVVVETPATATSKATATVTGSVVPPDAPSGAPTAPPKITLAPAKQLFGAVKTAAALPPRAIGGYGKGCIAGAKALDADGPAWQAMRLSRDRYWGHPKLLTLLQRFATDMQTKENWPGILIGDISQPRGGPMVSRHKSHQLGLDADIWYTPKPATQMTRAERETIEPLLLAEDKGTEVIAANWNEGFVRLIKRAASYPEVERIFVHPAIKKEFCKVAGTDRAWLRKVRPLWLHNDHFHVRIGCPAGSPACEHQKAPPDTDDGCGKEVDNWLKLVSAPDKPAPAPAVPPAAPSPPPAETTMLQMPMECRAVLTAGEAKDGPAHKAIADIALYQAAAVAEKAAKAAAKAKEKAAAKSAAAGTKSARTSLAPVQ